MPVGTPITGQLNTIEIAATTLSGGVYTPVTYDPLSDMNRVDDNKTRGSTNVPVFGRTAPHQVPGAPDHGFTISGFWSQGDTGQIRADAAEVSQAVVSLRVLRDGVNGYRIEGRIAARREGINPEGLIDLAYDFAPVNTKTVIGTG
jgi:hypothetical protein